MKKILVIGETCIDEYVYGSCDRVCPEAAALCFRRSENAIAKTNLGMAGNVVNNLKSISADFIIDIITNNNNKPIIKKRYIDQRYNTIVFREDINDTADRLILNKDISIYDAIIISDYNKGFLHEEDYQTISSMANSNCLIFADTKKKITNDIAQCVDFLKINSLEFENISSNINVVSSLCQVVVTKGGDGAILFNSSGNKHFPTSTIEVRDVCGAGDTFLAGLVIEILLSNDTEQAINFANVCAGRVVSKFGVSVP
jgi:D-beta-D-heptose 7-phosphate kinase/D-beta-D-heptose 1-phosphate adenosyltransferase